jgi:hypothetical protein
VQRFGDKAAPFAGPKARLRERLDADVLFVVQPAERVRQIVGERNERTARKRPRRLDDRRRIEALSLAGNSLNDGLQGGLRRRGARAYGKADGGTAEQGQSVPAPRPSRASRRENIRIGRHADTLTLIGLCGISPDRIGRLGRM